MLLSMTGFGNASHQSGDVYVSTEMKSVNNRYLKLSVRMPDTLARFEAEIEKLVRARVARGSVQLSIRMRFLSGQSEYRIDPNVLQGYQQQLQQLTGQAAAVTNELLQLPGVVVESELEENLVQSIWPTVESAINETLDHFHDFRAREGESMRVDLERQCVTIESELAQVETAAPQVVAEYREKMLERVRRVVSSSSVQVEPSDVLREVAVFADRCDINEEITRLKSHIEQFRRMLNSDQSMGRKLEFIGQEMFREINTIGSKANNVGIAHSVVEMKVAIERIREVLQNVE
ncbi:MAG: YicC family protein [Planctomycetaceae bacterium]|nr:YicC family protein [Planctomycetaceae bacterium]